MCTGSHKKQSKKKFAALNILFEPVGKSDGIHYERHLLIRSAALSASKILPFSMSSKASSTAEVLLNFENETTSLKDFNKATSFLPALVFSLIVILYVAIFISFLQRYNFL